VEETVFASGLADKWLIGEVSTSAVAGAIANNTVLSAQQVEAHMRSCVHGLPVNATVKAFVSAQRHAGKKTAMVTVNSDLFSQEVVPDQHLNEYFDLILSSSDQHTTNKELLWDSVFDRLGTSFSYTTSLLIDDEQRWVERFCARGGAAALYTSEDAFAAWVADLGSRIASEGAS
jgi:FMN phosphatase YigB (HAD superfamily)